MVDSFTTAAASAAATPTHLPGLAVEIFDGADSSMPMAASKVPVAFNVSPCLNYSNINSVKNGLDAANGLVGPLFALAGKTLGFDLRFTGECRW